MATSSEQQQNAFNYLQLFSSIPVKLDQLSLSAKSYPITVSTPTHTDNLLADGHAFASGNFENLSYFMTEIECIAEIERWLAEGRDFLAFLYAYRGIARAIPQTSTSSDQDGSKADIYEKTFTILKPQVDKMRALMTFSEEMSIAICNFIRRLKTERKDAFYSENVIISITKIFSLVFMMDTLKNAKSSLNNDFSMYKRALANLKKTTDVVTSESMDETAENQKLYMFLAVNDVMSKKLLSEIGLIPEGDEFLIELLNTISGCLERQFLVPEDRYTILKGMTMALYLFDQPNQTEDAKRKKLKVDKYLKIFRSFPIIPLFGDMPVNLLTVLGRSSISEFQRLDYNRDDEQHRNAYLLSRKYDKAKSDYNQFMIDYSKMMINKNIEEYGKINLETSLNNQLYLLIIRSMNLLAEWSDSVLMQTCWKYSNPAKPDNITIPESAQLYELAIRYNHSPEELFILTEYVSMIKSLSTMLMSNSNIFQNIINLCVFAEIQGFFQGPFQEMFTHVEKKKKGIAGALYHLYQHISDANDSSGASSGKDKKKTTKKDDQTTAAKTRSVYISPIQLHLIKVILESAVSEKAKGMKGGLLREKDFKDNHIQFVTEFLYKLQSYVNLVDFRQTVLRCSDLSDLWFKEFYLELSKQIQFPIEMSLPWILTKYILDNDSVDKIDNLLYSFDIYNDAAQHVQHVLGVQYLYDEIEAELNLCFDQFIYKLSDRVFTYYKIQASAMLLDRDVRVQLPGNVFIGSEKLVNFNRYKNLLKQSNFQLLGRSVNISMLIAQNVNMLMRKSVDLAINRFEGSDITYVLEFAALLNVNRVAHDLLAELLPIDSWSNIFNEINEDAGLKTYNGRIVTHIIAELINDFLPNYNFHYPSGKFVRTTKQLVQQAQRTNWARAHSSQLFGSKPLCIAYHERYVPYRSFFNLQHVNAIFNIMGVECIPLLLESLKVNVEVLLRNTVTPFMGVLMKGIPSSCKLPLYEYGAQGTYDYFHAVLKPLLGYPQLRVEVCQVFREIGNTLVLAQYIDEALKTKLCIDTINFTPFTLPNNKFNFKNIVKQTAELFPTLFGQLNFVDEQADRILEYYNLTSFKSLTVCMLESINSALLTVAPSFMITESHDILSIEQSQEFHRIWSVLLFAYCTTSDKEESIRTIFGDGFLWSGPAIMHVLGQKYKYLTFDVSRHIIAVYDTDINYKSNPETDRFLSACEYNTMLEAIAFDIFQNLYPKK